nr:odorant binding protein 27 [Pachyrhinus yasumatsui]
MAKIVFVILSVLLIAGVSGEISSDIRIRSLQYLAECIKEWNVTFETVAKAIFSEEGFPTDRNFKELTFCLARKSGVIDQNGTIQKDLSVKYLKMVVNSDKEVDRLYTKCAIQYETPKETAFQVANCFHLEGVTL